jgi:hypothetical protein
MSLTKFLAPLAIGAASLIPVLQGCGGGDAADSGGTSTASTANSTTSGASTAASPAADGASTAAGGAKAEAGKVPDAAEQERLVKTTLSDFNEGVQSKDFTKFHGTISKIWAEQMGPDKLATAFKPLTDQNDKGTNIAPALENMKPVMEPAATIDDNGLLVLKGYYPTKPSRANFELKYIIEDDAWKSAGVNLKLAKAPA